MNRFCSIMPDPPSCPVHLPTLWQRYPAPYAGGIKLERICLIRAVQKIDAKRIIAIMGLHDRQAAASIWLRARAMPANQPWISALLRGSSDRFPVLSSA